MNSMTYKSFPFQCKFLVAVTLFAIFSCQKNSHLQPKNLIKNHADSVVGKNVSMKSREAKSTVYIHAEEGDGSYTLCTGTLIHPKVILTAAHCLGGNPQSYTVYWTQSFDPAAHSNGKILKISHFRIHPQYNFESTCPGRTKTENDVALIVLKNNAPEQLQVADFTSTEKFETPNQEFLALGFGATRFDGTALSGADQLRSKKLNILSLSSDKKTFYVEQKKGGICKGDSGGPAFVRTQDQLYVIGIAKNIRLNSPLNPTANITVDSNLYSAAGSDKTLCPDPKKSSRHKKINYCALWSQYSRVSYYKSWIQNEISQLPTTQADSAN